MHRLLISLLIVLFSVTCFADEVIPIRQFKGLSTGVNPLLTKVGDAAVAHNVDFSRNGIGSLSKRLGFDSISTITGQDSVIAIFPIYYADGTQQLFVVTDPIDTGYGHIYVSNIGSVNIEIDSLTKVWTYWAIQTLTNHDQHGDNVYIVNGSQKGAICTRQSDGSILCREYPIRAPGEPIITPVGHTNFWDGGVKVDDTDACTGACDSTTTGELNGEYIYRISSNGGGQTDDRLDGIVTTRVRIKNGRVLMNGFQIPPSDSVTVALSPQPTNVTINISRTHAFPGPLRPSSDSSFALDILGPMSIAAIDTLTFTDSIPDGALNELLTTTGRIGRDTNGVSTYRYGAPRYQSASDSTYSTTKDDNGRSGIFYGIPEQQETLGVAYACTFIDTITGIESDTGRSVFFFVTQNDATPDSLPYSYTLSLPNVPPVDSAITGIPSRGGVVKNLYRANMFSVTKDSGFYQDVFGREVEFVTEPDGGGVTRTVKDVLVGEEWVESRVIDTVIVGPFLLVGQFTASDTIFTDSLRYDKLNLESRVFTKPTPPSLLSNILIHDGRLFGTQGSRVYWSRLLNGADTIQSWGQLNVLPINESDGDIGTAFFKKRGVIRYMKNRATYNIFQPSGGIDWTLTELAGDFGCIAPLSVSSNRNGTYYLSNDGVILETEGLRRERQISIDLISKRLDNFDNLSFVVKQNAVGVALPDDKKYLLSIPSLDTTYVYDEQTDDWSTWGLSFKSAFKYGAESRIRFTPGDTTYFFKDSTLFRFGTSELDNDKRIEATWRSQPMLSNPIGSGYRYKQITKIATHLGITGSAAIFYAHGTGIGDSLSATNITGSNRIRMNGSYSPTFLDYSLKITLNPVADTLFTSNSIDGIDLFWQPMEEMIID